MAVCDICNVRLQSHSKTLSCSICTGRYHINCLPFISREDSIYTERNFRTWICISCTGDIFPFNHCDDDDSFIEYISDYWRIKPTISSLKRTLFSPFELNSDKNSPLSESDPDINLYNMFYRSSLPSCDYYSEDAFNDMYRRHDVPDSKLTMIHSNIRSIPCNLNSFDAYLENLSINFTVIAFTETWLKDTNAHAFGMDGYNSVHNCRPDRKGGGIALYVKDCISFSVRKDLFYNNDNIETAFIEVDRGHLGTSNNVMIGVIYRPPDKDMGQFNDLISDILSVIKAEGKSCFLLGDYNINLLNTESQSLTREFVNTMYSFSMFPNITKPSRERSCTLIDNIFSNDMLTQHDTISGLLDTDITDHYPVFHIVFESDVKTRHTERPSRIINEENTNKFLSKLQSHDWNDIMSSTETQEAFSSFHGTFLKLYDECFPFRRKKSVYRSRKPLLSDALKKSIKVKNALYRNSRDYPSVSTATKYKQYKNKLSILLKVSEKNHYTNLMEEYKNNLRNSWRILKEVINKRKNRSACSKFMLNGQFVTDKTMISNSFNSFFVNMGPNLASKIPHSNIPCTKYIPGGRHLQSLLLSSTYEEEIKICIRRLNDGSPGWDNITSKIIKASCNHIVRPLTHIFNLSLTTGVFPTELKIARVIPLFKSGDPHIFSNYRPVSVLPILSKILERLMYNRILNYLNNNNLLYEYQFGFREKHSPNLAMIYLVDKISNALQNGEYVLGLYLEFSKAFDTVNHKILLEKLEFYGIRGVALKWLTDYLSDRKQFVEYDSCASSYKDITCGVPQGSILGPLLFLIYINDLANVSEKMFSLFFADDSSLFLSGHKPDDLINEMNNEMKYITEWLSTNKLSLNIDKTHYMLFKSKGRYSVITKDLIINEVKISQVEKTKFLGVYIDNVLSWKDHIQYIEGKIARSIGAVIKARKVFNQETLRTLYYTFIYPYFNYCLEAWGNTYATYLDPLSKLQNRALRVITGSPRRTRLAQLYSNLKLLQFPKIYMYSVQLLMYERHQGIMPSIFQSFFCTNFDVSGRNTRQSGLLRMPEGKLSVRRRTVSFSGVSLHNYFVNLISYNSSLVTYKRMLKNVLIINNNEPDIPK